MPSDMTPQLSPVRPSFATSYPFVDTLDRHFAPTETFAIALTLAMGVLGYALSYALGQAVAWSAFGGVFAFSVGLVGVGTYLRTIKAMPYFGTATLWCGVLAGLLTVITLLFHLRYAIYAAVI